MNYPQTTSSLYRIKKLPFDEGGLKGLSMSTTPTSPPPDSGPPLSKTTSHYRKGFTLIEMLSVIAVIAILASLIVPLGSHLLEKGRRAQAQSNLRQICQAYYSYMNETATPRVITAESVNQFAERLAQSTGLSEASLWYVSSAPDVVHRKSTGELSQKVGDTRWKSAPISYEIASGIPPGAPPETTPLIWTKGIPISGKTWNPDSPWSGKGGHIGFLDGHVEWFEDLTQALTHYTRRTAMAQNLQEALPPKGSVPTFKVLKPLSGNPVSG